MVYRSRRLNRVVLFLVGVGLAPLLLYVAAPALVVFALGSWVQAQTGRTLMVEKAAIDWGGVTSIELRGVRLENAPWGEAPWMIAMERLRMSAPLMELLRGNALFHDVEVEGLALSLEMRQGEGNWQFARPSPFFEWRGGRLPTIQSLQAQNITVRFHDPARESDITGAIAGATGTLTPAQWLVTGAGVLDHKQFTFDLRSDGPMVELTLSLGESNTFVRGPQTSGDYRVEVRGSDLREAFPIIPVPLPSTPAYHFTAQLKREGAAFNVHHIVGTVGDTDMQGELRVTFAAVPVVRGRLSSRTLHLADMKGFLGLPVRGPPPQPGKVIPPNLINRQRFHRLHLQLDYDANDVVGGKLPLDGVRTHIAIADGLLEMAPLTLNVAKGSVTGAVRLDVRGAHSSGAIQLDFSRLQLRQLAKRLPFLDASHGQMRGHMELTGEGDSLAELFGNSHGEVLVLMTEGALERAFIDGLKGDILRFFAEQDGKATTRLDCAIALFDVERGVARADALVTETASALIAGRGEIDLEKERLDLSLIANSKEGGASIGSTPLYLTGTFVEPQMALDVGPAAGRGLAAVTLGLLLGPLAAVAPFIQEGSEEEQACSAIVERITAREE